MAIEVLSHGACKAAGAVVLGANPAASSIRAIGIEAMEVDAAGGLVQLTFLEPIGEDEFLALALPSQDGPSGELRCTWQSDTVCLFQLTDSAGDPAQGSFFFALYQLLNAGEVTPTQLPV